MALHKHQSVTKGKAKKILKDKNIRGKKLSGKQKRFFGLVAGGGTPTKISKKNRLI